MERDTFNEEVLQRITAIETNMNLVFSERKKIQEEIVNLEMKSLQEKQDIQDVKEQISQFKSLMIKIVVGVGGIAGSVAISVIQKLLG